MFIIISAKHKERLIKLKKFVSLFLIAVIGLSFAACGKSGGDDSYHKLGETVSTDIFEFTLNAAEFTIALNNVNDDKRFTPKEYDAKDDADNPYVAPVGHTYAAFSYTVKNLNRASSEFHSGSFATVKYDGKKYSAMKDGAFFQYEAEKYMDTDGKLKTKNAGEWYSDPGNNLLLMTNEKETRRARVEIETDIKDLTADVEITFKIPNSEGKKEEFTYLVTAADRESYTKPEIEMSLETALASFTNDAANAYFAEHLNEYDIVSGEDASKILPDKKWSVSYNIFGAASGTVSGSWTGTFYFEESGKIKDDYGYVNNRSWSIDGDTIIIDGKMNCEMRRVADRTYLLVCEGKPYLLMK